MAEIDLGGKIDYSIYNFLFTTTVTRNMIKVFGMFSGVKNRNSNVVRKASVFTIKQSSTIFEISLNTKRKEISYGRLISGEASH